MGDFNVRKNATHKTIMAKIKEYNKLKILGVYKDIETAKKVYRENIKDNKAEFDYDYDKETPYTEEFKNGICMVRLFKDGLQENWDNYLEIYIEEQEVK